MADGATPSSRLPGSYPSDIDGELVHLADLCDGCRDDANGRASKMSLTTSFLGSTGRDALDVVCALHLLKSLKIAVDGLLGEVAWRKPPSGVGRDAAPAPCPAGPRRGPAADRERTDEPPRRGRR